MMKRLYAAGALFVFVLSMCVTSSCLTRRVENRVGVFLEQSLDEFISENDDAAFQNLEKAMTNWNDIKETTAVFASHSSVDELDEQLTELYAMAQGGSDGKIPKIKLCLLKIQNLCDDEKFSVKALFYFFFRLAFRLKKSRRTY